MGPPFQGRAGVADLTAGPETVRPGRPERRDITVLHPPREGVTLTLPERLGNMRIDDPRPGRGGATEACEAQRDSEGEWVGSFSTASSRPHPGGGEDRRRETGDAECS